jgi:hypothetical protein
MAEWLYNFKFILLDVNCIYATPSRGIKIQSSCQSEALKAGRRVLAGIANLPRPCLATTLTHRI